MNLPWLGIFLQFLGNKYFMIRVHISLFHLIWRHFPSWSVLFPRMRRCNSHPQIFENLEVLLSVRKWSKDMREPRPAHENRRALPIPFVCICPHMCSSCDTCSKQGRFHPDFEFSVLSTHNQCYCLKAGISWSQNESARDSSIKLEQFQCLCLLAVGSNFSTGSVLLAALLKRIKDSPGPTFLEIPSKW